jgi:actin-like ATPase involved in cell morphogenesis
MAAFMLPHEASPEEGSAVRVLSIDLGTSNTVAVLAEDGRSPRVVDVDGSATMPSAVYAAEDGTLLVGRDAERRARLDPSRFEPNPKRRIDEQTLLLGSDVVPVSEALAAVLRRVLNEVIRQLGGTQPDEVRLTHPAQWGQTRRSVLMSAARQAGITGAITLVPEPVAAAAHFASFPGHALAPGQALAVYDLGAGTFDAAVVGATQDGGFTVLAEDGLSDLGGLDVDQALLVHVGRSVSHSDPQRWQRLLRPETTAERRARRALQEDVKAAKEALSRHPQTEVPMPEPFQDVLVTREELEALVRPAMLRSIELMARVLRSAQLTPQQLAGIYLVGGSSRLPLVGSMISEKLGVVPSSLDQPETAVALGAHHVTVDGITVRTQAAAAAGNSGPHRVADVAQEAQATGPIAGSQVSPLTGTPSGPYRPAGHSYPSLSSQQTTPSNFPQFPVVGKRKKRSRGKIVAAVAAAVVVLAGAGAGGWMLWGQQEGPQTFTAEQCRDPGKPDSKGFTGCMRQLAGAVADSEAFNCDNEVSGSFMPPEALGVRVECVPPKLPGGHLYYVHGRSGEELEAYATSMLNTAAGGSQVQADWAGNGLKGRYAAVTGPAMSVLTFRVNDRPLLGVLLQEPSIGPSQLKSPDDLADYFEQRIQPGTVDD